MNKPISVWSSEVDQANELVSTTNRCPVVEVTTNDPVVMASRSWKMISPIVGSESNALEKTSNFIVILPAENIVVRYVHVRVGF